MSMQEVRKQVESDCSRRVIGAMEDFLWTLLGLGGGDDIVNRLMECGEYARPYLSIVNGGDPGNTISAALSYYQYVRLVRGELHVNGDYLGDINDDLASPDLAYSVIINNMARALRAQDYVTASFLADLAFIARSYALCVGNSDEGNCDWIKRAFKVRVLILRRFSSH